MKHTSVARRPKIALSVGLCLGSFACAGLVLLAGGCGSANKPVSTTLTPADFAGDSTAAAGMKPGAGVNAAPARAASIAPDATTEQTSIRAIDATRERVEVTGPIGASEGVLDVTTSTGMPTASAGAVATREAVLVDAKIGEINNKAIYASAFLDPLLSRLKAKWTDLQKTNPRGARRTWYDFTSGEVLDRLNQQVEDELLRAEALASLSPEQRQGFFFFMEKAQSNLFSENRGSRAITDEKLREESGIDSTEWRKRRENEELIRFQLGKRIYQRISVSQRDIQLAYQRNYDVFNPDPAARFRLITVPKANEAGVAEITDALESGEDFISAASREVNTYDHAKGGVRDVPLTNIPNPDDLSSAEIFPSPVLNKVAQQLSPGRYVGPFDWGNDKAWLYLEEIRRESRSQYDAQLAIENELRNRRSAVQRYRYIQRLKDRAAFTDIETMTARLVGYAAERCLPPEQRLPIVIDAAKKVVPSLGPAEVKPKDGEGATGPAGVK